MGVKFRCDNDVCQREEDGRFNAINDVIAPSAKWYILPTENKPKVFCSKACGVEWMNRFPTEETPPSEVYRAAPASAEMNDADY